ncbi:hypothetical protein QW131_34015 [Roseibium salinum]|nr:hypothetical protein [Roseibium salinum]
MSVNIGYGYDIRGEISAEKGRGVAWRKQSDSRQDLGKKFSGRVPADWRERFIAAYDAEIAEWVIAASKGGATGPSAWDGYAITAVSDAALKAANTGEAADVTLVDRPALYGN